MEEKSIEIICFFVIMLIWFIVQTICAFFVDDSFFRYMPMIVLVMEFIGIPNIASLFGPPYISLLFQARMLIDVAAGVCGVIIASIIYGVYTWKTKSKNDQKEEPEQNEVLTKGSETQT